MSSKAIPKRFTDFIPRSNRPSLDTDPKLSLHASVSNDEATGHILECIPS